MNNQGTETLGGRELVVGLYGAIAADDLTAARAVLHPDVALHVPGNHPLAGIHVGPEAVLAFAVGSRRLTDDGERIEVVDVLEGTDHIGVYCTVRATRLGRRLDNRTIHLVHVRDGLVAELWLHNYDDLSVNDFWS